jgi:hypothetical protein
LFPGDDGTKAWKKSITLADLIKSEAENTEQEEVGESTKSTAINKTSESREFKSHGVHLEMFLAKAKGCEDHIGRNTGNDKGKANRMGNGLKDMMTHWCEKLANDDFSVTG